MLGGSHESTVREKLSAVMSTGVHPELPNKFKFLLKKKNRFSKFLNFAIHNSNKIIKLTRIVNDKYKVSQYI